MWYCQTILQQSSHISPSAVNRICASDVNLKGKLWEKYWQCQLFTYTHGMKSVADLHSSKGNNYRKNGGC